VRPSSTARSEDAEPLTESEDATVSRRQAVAQVVFGVGGALASTVYGTVVVMATLTAAYASEKNPWRLALLVAATVVVFWLAHLYAHGISESITLSRRLTLEELTHIARREAGIVLAAVAPFAALVLGATRLLHETTAVWLALAIGLVTLGVEGLRYARLRGFGPTATLGAVVVNLSLGLFVVALKVAVAH
jgi:FtsH-binding integral membrane protein